MGSVAADAGGPKLGVLKRGSFQACPIDAGDSRGRKSGGGHGRRFQGMREEFRTSDQNLPPRFKGKQEEVPTSDQNSPRRFKGRHEEACR